jgi:hypothetical protein
MESYVWTIDWKLLGKYADIIGIFSAIIGIITTIVAGYAGYQAKQARKEAKKEKERLKQEVKIVLRSEDKENIKPPISSIIKARLSRAEIMGILRMIPRIKEKQYVGFKLSYTNTQKFMDELNRISNSDKPETFIIHCSKEELKQFVI